MVGVKGDIVHKVYLKCGHIDIDIQENAAKKPCWMLYEPEVGSHVTCPFCGENTEVVNVERIRGWGDT